VVAIGPPAQVQLTWRRLDGYSFPRCTVSDPAAVVGMLVRIVKSHRVVHKLFVNQASATASDSKREYC
jgi:hypothetical protein